MFKNQGTFFKKLLQTKLAWITSVWTKSVRNNYSQLEILQYKPINIDSKYWSKLLKCPQSKTWAKYIYKLS